MHDDKRQFTGNVLHNAAGHLIGWHGIYQGTTDWVLPSPEARGISGAESFLFSKTINHYGEEASRSTTLSPVSHPCNNITETSY